MAAIREQKTLAEACGNTMKVGMVGRGRAKDNIWIEGFWRTIKRAYIHLNPCDNAIGLRKGIEKFMQYYTRNGPIRALTTKSRSANTKTTNY